MRKIDFEQERAFENEKTLKSDVRKAQSRFYWATAIPISEHKSKIFEKIRGQSVLEIGCSKGDDAIQYCQYSASYVGIDLSDEAINVAKQLTLHNAEFLCVDGHTIPRSDAEFDCVIVNSLLHHLDLAVSLKEIRRVLKHDGFLAFREPLGTNPLFHLYRVLTPTARTSDERPFTFSDLNMMRRYFDLTDVCYFGFFNLISAFARKPALRKHLTQFDNALSATPLKYFFWQFCGFARAKRQ